MCVCVHSYEGTYLVGSNRPVCCNRGMSIMSYSLLHLSHLKNDFPPPEAAPECFSKSLPILCILKFKESTMPVKSMNLEGSNQSCAAIMDNSSSGGGGGGGRYPKGKDQ